MSKFIIIDKVYKAGCKLLKWLKIMDVENHESYRLYKYYAPMDYNFDALYNGYWFFSKFGHANDPFDCDLSLLDIIKNKWNLNSKDIDKEAIKNFAICSFSDSQMRRISKDITKHYQMACSSMSYTPFAFYRLMFSMCLFPLFLRLFCYILVARLNGR